MSSFHNYALLIGIEDYSTYDRSADQPAGTTDLPGAAADARVFFRQCIAMGFSPERIRVLTSPGLSPADLGPEAREENVGAATHDAIVAGLEWIVKAVDTDTPASGLITFSGHGMDDGGVVLCPSDTTISLEQVIRVSAVHDRIGSRKARQNLTVLLDSCHTEVRANEERSLRTRLAGAAKAFPDGVGAERVISACQRDQVSDFTMFGGEWRGAFTWAITSAMSQWRSRADGDVLRLDVSYGELVIRTRSLLSALSFKQVPQLSGGKLMDRLAFLQSGVAPREGWTSKEPDQVRAHGQLVPQKYAMWMPEISSEYPFTTINVNPSQEQWYVDRTIAGQTDSTLNFQTCTDNSWPKMQKGCYSTETAATAVTWAVPQSRSFPQRSTTYTSTAYRYKDGNGDIQTGQLSISFVFTTDGQGNTVIQSTTWYNPTNSNIDLSYNGGALHMSLDNSGAYPESATCYYALARMGYS